MAFTNPNAKGSGPTPDVNVTPLVDVALVVLIIFMVVAPLLTKTFQVAVSPNAKEGGPPPTTKPDEPLVLTVDEAGALRLGATVVTEQELASNIVTELAADPDRVLNVQASDDVAYGTVAHALDVSRGAGAKRIAILTRPPSVPAGR